MNTGDHWPWEAREQNPKEPFNETTFLSHGESIWVLKTSIIGKYCISYQKGLFSTPVGDVICLGQKFYDDTAQGTQWWGASNHMEAQPHPLADFPRLTIAWNNLTTGKVWQEPKGPYWILGNEFTQSFPMTGLDPVCWAPLAFFPPALPQTRWKFRSLHIWGKDKQKKNKMPYT
jgi:hypothetical protein